MIRDIEDGKINIVLCKDLSRLGRNNALVAYYTEIFFPDNDVRFICVTEGIDTFKGDNEIMPFKSVINEYYARDISRKVKSAYRTKAMNGEFTAAFAPYGYLKDPDNKHRLIIDEDTAPVVKRIRHLFWRTNTTAPSPDRTVIFQRNRTPGTGRYGIYPR